VPYVETSRGGVTYRSFRPDAPGKYGALSHVGFRADGGACINVRTGKAVGFLRGGYPTVGQSETTGGARRANHRLKAHVAVAYLWGAPNVSRHPMSEQLVVDHINGVKTDYELGNVRLTTQHHNAQLGNGVAAAAGSQSVRAAAGASSLAAATEAHVLAAPTPLAAPRPSPASSRSSVTTSGAFSSAAASGSDSDSRSSVSGLGALSFGGASRGVSIASAAAPAAGVEAAPRFLGSAPSGPTDFLPESLERLGVRLGSGGGGGISAAAASAGGAGGGGAVAPASLLLHGLPPPALPLAGSKRPREAAAATPAGGSAAAAVKEDGRTSHAKAKKMLVAAAAAPGVPSVTRFFGGGK
jgi:hypothetical protein